MAQRILTVLLVSLTLSVKLVAQTSSFGPGKGPAPGSGASKYTYPQPPKPTPYNPANIRPAYQVPENPEKSVWRLTAKVDGRDPTGASNEVSVYSFLTDGRRVQVGKTNPGSEISLDEFRPVGRTLYYKYTWAEAPTQSNGALQASYWVSGSNVEYAGKK